MSIVTLLGVSTSSDAWSNVIDFKAREYGDVGTEDA